MLLIKCFGYCYYYWWRWKSCSSWNSCVENDCRHMSFSFFYTQSNASSNTQFCVYNKEMNCYRKESWQIHFRVVGSEWGQVSSHWQACTDIPSCSTSIYQFCQNRDHARHISSQQASKVGFRNCWTRSIVRTLLMKTGKGLKAKWIWKRLNQMMKMKKTVLLYSSIF